MLCHPEPGSAVSYALRNAKSPFTCMDAKVLLRLDSAYGSGLS